MKKTVLALATALCAVGCAPKQNQNPLRLNCLVSVAPENRAEYIEVALAHVEASRQDEGNIAFDLLGSTTDSSSLLIFETWKDQAALDAHTVAEHSQASKKLTGVLASTIIQKVQAEAEPEGESVIRVNCPTKVPAENCDSLITIFNEMTACSLKDEGNISYCLYRSLTDSTSFVVLETWKDQESLDKHFEAEHFKRLVPQINAIAEQTVEVYKMAKPEE